MISSSIPKYQHCVIGTQPQTAHQYRLSKTTKTRNRERLSEQLRNRITHNYNEMSLDEIRTFQCMALEEFVNKNQDLRCNFHRIRGLKEALESEEVRRNLDKIDSIFVGSFGYNWNLHTFGSIHGLVPINSDFRNAALAHIVGKAHRRCSFNIQKARGRPIIIAISLRMFNLPPNFSMNGIPFLSLYGPYSTIGDCYYGIANSYSQWQFYSNSSSSSSVVSVPPKFRYIPDPKGHYSMENNLYIAGLMGPRDRRQTKGNIR